MQRPLLPRLALALGSLGLSMAVAEAVARQLPDATLGFSVVDGALTRVVEFEADPARNGAGYHDAPITALEPGQRRVLLLGDSYVAAVSMPVERTVGQRMEAHLGPGWDVVSLGIPGWGQRQQLDALQGVEIPVDVVVTLVLPFNDVRENSAELTAAQERFSAALPRRRPGWFHLPLDALPAMLLPGSKVNQLVSHRISGWQARRAARSVGPATIPIDYFVYVQPPHPVWEAAWRTTEALLAEQVAWARGRGAQPLLAIASTPHGVLGAEAGRALLVESYPGLGELDLDLEAPARRVAAVGAALEVPTVDLQGPFEARTAAGATLHWPVDGHWNAAGNDLAGALLADAVREAVAPQ